MKNTFLKVLMSGAVLFTVGCSSNSAASSAAASSASEEPAETAETKPEETQETTADTGADFTMGETTGNVYSNEFFGVKFVMDGDWVVASEEELEQLNSNLVEVMNDESAKQMLENGSVVTGFYATNPSTNQLVTFVFQHAGIALQPADVIDASLSAVTQQLESQGLTDIEASRVTATFLGNEEPALQVSGTMSGVTLYEKQVYLTKKGYFMIVTTGAYYDDTTDSILSMFEKY